MPRGPAFTTTSEGNNQKGRRLLCMRRPCSREAHHLDYEWFPNVLWLCREHHLMVTHGRLELLPRSKVAAPSLGDGPRARLAKSILDSTWAEFLRYKPLAGKYVR